MIVNNTTTDRTSTSRQGNAVDLGIGKQGPAGPLDDGDTASYTLTVTNYGRDPQSPAGGSVTDVLPAGLEFRLGLGRLQLRQRHAHRDLQRAAAGQGGTAVFTLETKLDKPYRAPARLVNSATVSVPGDGNPDNDKSTTTTPLKPGPDTTAAFPRCRSGA